MRLETELAILSACETGTGALARGEGIMSLGRAFKYAGCPSIAMSLWKVNDQATHKIIQRFCEELKNGVPKDKAMQLAKLSYLEGNQDIIAHPYFWAPFIMLGNTQPLTNLPDGARWVLPAMSLLLLALLILVVWWQRQKKNAG
jgi:CHAT domain-containing protein